jgi:PEP-CTERM motif
MLNGVRYVTFTDELAPLHPTTVTVSNGAAETLAVDFDVDTYVGITNRTEALTINFAGANDFISGIGASPASGNVLGTGVGSVSLLYADDCQHNACGPGGVFFSGGSFSINRIEIGAAAPEPATYGLFGIVVLTVSLVARRRTGA